MIAGEAEPDVARRTRKVERELSQRKIKFVLRRGAPDEVALKLGEDAALVVVDRGYLRHQKRWRERVAASSRRGGAGSGCSWCKHSDLLRDYQWRFCYNQRS